MGNAGKYLLVTIACIALLIAGRALFERPRDVQASPAPAQTVAAVPMAHAQPAVARQNPGPAPGTTQVAPISAPVVHARTIPLLPPHATSVPDEDLLILTALVDLPNATAHQPDKAKWKQAITAAEQLMQGPCDCEQRNWLSHFVEMGNFALAGSETEYRRDAALLATLARNDRQPIASNAR